jgi:hypothetical protein
MPGMHQACCHSVDIALSLPSERVSTISRAVQTVLGIGLGVAWGAYGMQSPPGDEPPPALPFQRRTRIPRS